MTTPRRGGEGKAPKAKHAGGRPSLYRPMYCQALVRWCKKGLSYESFASACNVSEQTLYDWEKAHPEFLEAKKIGYPHCRAFWERAGIAGKIPAGTWIFNMKNRFGWRDKSPEESAESAEVIAKAMIAYANTL